MSPLTCLTPFGGSDLGILPLVVATREAWEVLTGSLLHELPTQRRVLPVQEFVRPPMAEDSSPLEQSPELLAEIQLHGETARGILQLLFPWSTARSLTEHWLQETGSCSEELVRDSLGELANVLGGHAKDSLGLHSWRLSIPQVMPPHAADGRYASAADVHTLTFHSDFGSWKLGITFLPKPCSLSSACPGNSGKSW